MEQKFTSWLVKEHHKTKLAPIDYLLIFGALVAGILLRVKVWNAPFENAPYQNTVFAMKLVSVVFDVLVAVIVGVLVHQMTRHKIKALLAYAICLMLPVMAAGSAMWGMCDSVYLFFVLLSIYLLIADERFFVLSLVFYGMSVFFHLNALFLFPVYIWVFWKRKAVSNVVLAFVSPVIGVIMHVLMDQGASSAFIMFREEGKLAAARESVLLSYHFPNLFQLIGVDAYVHEYGTGFRYIVIGAVMIVTVVGIKTIKELSKQKIILLCLVLSIAIPWFLPFMDERAGLLAAVFSLIYGFVKLSQFYIPIIQITITYLAYAAYFRGESFLPMSAIAIVQFGMLLYLIYTNLGLNKKFGEENICNNHKN